MTFTRRRLLETSAVALALVGSGLASLPAAAQGAFDMTEMLKPGALPDMILGKADAKVTIVEYASMTCGHCAHFHEAVLPHLKSKYIDTGKVRLVYREFPLDPLAAAVSMLSRCAPTERYFDMTGLYYRTLKQWAGASDPVEALFQLSRQADFTRDSFKTCLTNQKLLDDLTAGRTRASEKYKVDGTPTFFVNGRKVVGISTPEEMDKILAPLLGE
ncbi:MAG: DsbA family protein [Siculibacillus sp.]